MLDTAALRTIIARDHLTGDPAAGHNLPVITDPLAQLGMKLFFTKALGGGLDAACASCHHPLLGGGDALSLPVGVEAADPDFLGPGREQLPTAVHYDGGPNVPRNSPKIFNIGLYDKAMFLDGRVQVIGSSDSPNGQGAPIQTPDSPPGIADPAALNLTQAQARFPVTSDAEMRGQFLAGEPDNDVLRHALATRLADQTIPNAWLPEFQAAFGNAGTADQLITYQNISIAMGEYQRSQVFVDTPWRDFVEGDDAAIDADAKRGAVLFFTAASAGGAGCSACHGGDFFTDEEFHVIATPQIARGKGDGPAGDDDFGRARVTLQPVDRYAFRTPNLLNVTESAHYGHAGAYRTLREIVVHHLDPAAAIDSYDFDLAALDPGVQKEHAEANTRLALAQLETLRSNGQAKLQDVDLTATQIDQVVAFLETLTDRCVIDAECLSQWISDGFDPDGLRLVPTNPF